MIGVITTNAVDIRTLLSQPEGKTLEFKQDLSSLQPVLKTIIAFANTAGGILIIGRDKHGELLGLSDPLKEEERLANSIAENIRPILLPEISAVTLDNKHLLLVDVHHSVGPYHLKQLGKENGVFIRLGSSNRPASSEVIEAINRLKNQQSYDQEPCHGTSERDLDSEHVNQAFRSLNQKPTHNKLQSLGILVEQGKNLTLSNAGVILFAKDPVRERYFPDARVSCARFVGTTKVNFLDRFDVPGGILGAIEAVPTFIRRNTRLAAEIKEIRRRDISEYPTEALREALLNALVHTDYAMQGMRIMVAIFSDRLEIQNPGLLPFGMTLENFKSGISRIRNRVLARVFSELELIEQWGSGYKRIMEVCRKGGYPEPTWEEIGAVIRVTFYPHPKTQELSASPAPSRHQVGMKFELSPEELKLLKFCKTRQSIGAMMHLLKWKDRTKFRNKYVRPLLEKNLLAMSFPDRPNSSKQEYFSTEKGLACLGGQDFDFNKPGSRH